MGFVSGSRRATLVLKQAKAGLGRGFRRRARAQRQRPSPGGAVMSFGLSSGMVGGFLGLGVAADRSIRTPASELGAQQRS